MLPGRSFATAFGTLSNFDVVNDTPSDTTVDPAHPRVLVRYRNGSAWEATAVAPPNVTPSGHDCFQGGPIAIPDPRLRALRRQLEREARGGEPERPGKRLQRRVRHPLKARRTRYSARRETRP
jgi:hypothetical protein